MGVAANLGDALANRLDGLFQRNQVTFNVILDEVNKVRGELDNTLTNIRSLISAFRFFRFREESLNAGEYEIAIAIPREAVENEFGALALEFRKLDQYLGVFTEIATGSREPIQVRALSTSDLTAYLAVLPEVAKAFADALQQIVTLYGSILGLIIMHRQLGEGGASKKTKDALKEDIDDKIEKGLKKIATDLDKKYLSKLEASRAIELSKPLRDALSGIARRLDEGYGFDVRGAPPEPDATADEGDARVETARATYKFVMEARQTIRVFAPEGEPILKLPPEAGDNNQT